MAKYAIVSRKYVGDFQSDVNEYAEKGYVIVGKIDFYPETTHSTSRYVVLMELQDGVQSL